MKRSRRLLVIVGFVVVAVTVIGLTTVLASRYLRTAKKANASITCQTIGRTHIVVIKDGAAQPAHVEARLCDQLTIQNLDPQTRLIGFGDHSHHVAYNGVSERVLKDGQTMTLVLNQPGSYHFHDHYQSELEVTFNVQ